MCRRLLLRLDNSHLTDADMLSPKTSNEMGRPKSATGPPPPSYNQSARSPLLLAETTTTRTEVVTTTTTETTTHLFSIPYWRKRNGHLPASHQRQSIENGPRPTLAPQFDKALPPTPPNEEDVPPGLEKPTQSSSLFPTADSSFSRARTHSAGPQSATSFLAHAALGIGLPHASSAMSRNETNSISFMSSSSPEALSSPSVRRVKSSHRLQLRHVSDNPNSTKAADQLVERRRRGLSFGPTSFLNVSIPDGKGKAKEAEMVPSPSKPSPKSLTRKSSFWNKRKNTQSIIVEPAAPTMPQEDKVLTLPPLPPVQISPFKVHEFPSTSDAESRVQLPLGRRMSRSLSDCMLTSKLSRETPQAPTPSRPSLSQITASPERVSDSTSSVDSHNQPRLRPQTASPLLHRLSMGVFSSHESSPAPGPRPNHNGHTHAHSTPHLARKSESPIPKPLADQESPEIYLTRLKSAVSKAEVAGILASR